MSSGGQSVHDPPARPSSGRKSSFLSRFNSPVHSTEPFARPSTSLAEPASSGVDASVRVVGSRLRELDIGEKAISAAGAAILSALIVTPLDVAKTRLQAQAAAENGGQQHFHRELTRLKSAGDDLYIRPRTSVSDVASCPPRCPRPAVPGGIPQCPPSCFQYKGTWDVIVKVWRQEGALRLWRGTAAGLAIAIPTVGIYLPCYDVLREWMEKGSPGNDNQPSAIAPYAPLLAGSLSRSLACIVCSPLELARTRMQAQREMRAGVLPPGMLRTLGNALHSGPGSSVLGNVRLLWTGVGAQLSRDVPFSAICWTSLEPIRRWLLQMSKAGEPTAAELVGANFTAGVVAGALAAAATCPLDVAKTRRQIEMDPGRASSLGTVGTLREVLRVGGVRGMFVGVIPRVGRAAPSVGIVVSFYEVVKYLIGQMNR